MNHILNDPAAIDSLLDRLNATTDPTEHKKLLDELKGISDPSIPYKAHPDPMKRLEFIGAWIANIFSNNAFSFHDVKTLEAEFIALDTLVKNGKTTQEDRDKHDTYKAIIYQFMTYCIEIVKIMETAVEQGTIFPLKKALYMIEHVVKPLFRGRTSNKKGGSLCN